MPTTVSITGGSPSLRRSVYLPVVRNDLPQLFEVFDFADPEVTVGRRDATGWRRVASDGRLLALAVLGISISPLPVPRLLDGSKSSVIVLTLLCYWPVLCHAASISVGT